MIDSRTDVPPISSLGIPRSTVVGIVLDNGTGTKGCETCFFVVEHTLKCCIRRQSGIEATVQKKIQGDCCLGKKSHYLAGYWGSAKHRQEMKCDLKV